MAKPVLYHNPRCSKSRAAKQLLEERGITIEIVEYLEAPLSRAELEKLMRKLDRPIAEWIRTGEDAFKARGLSLETPEAELLDAVAEEPLLMERPIFASGDRAVVGRPPELVLDLV
ncbi:MAG: arsenate reductase (glutaredoxin) [bacterium]|nr:arsenate reductase (glutaredoxin) [bacterium]